MKTTIHDVARRAGVSIGTVSKVLNGTGRISVNTRQRVREAVSELAYHPSAIATALAGKNTHTIGLLLPDVNNPYYSEIVRGAEDEAFRRGYSVLIGNTDHDAEKERAYIETMLQKQLDGVAIATGSTPLSTVKDLLSARMKVVLLARAIEGAEVALVSVDNEQGGYLAASHLLDCGHRQIAYVSEPLTITSSCDRLRGFQSALAEYGVELASLAEGGFGISTGERLGREALSRGSLTAIFAANDQLAVGVLQACRHCGVRVPEDVAVMGFDNSVYSEIVTPSLTTVAQPMYALGKDTTSLLIEAIESDTQPTQQVILEPKLVTRRSTRRLTM